VLGRTKGTPASTALARLSVDGVWLTRVRLSDERGDASIAGAPPGPSWCLPIWSACAGGKVARPGFLDPRNYAPGPGAASAAPAAQARFVEFVLSSGGGEAKK